MQTTKTVKAGERTQHTPGPWKADGDLDGIRDDYREDRCIVTEDFDYDDHTGSIIGVLRGHGSQLRANARLIAAAPELLEALREIASGNHWKGEQESIARAAIAKAEGDNGWQEIEAGPERIDTPEKANTASRELIADINNRFEVEATLSDPTTSHWLHGALSSALKRDCVDALHDAERLAAILERRTRAILKGVQS